MNRVKLIVLILILISCKDEKKSEVGIYLSKDTNTFLALSTDQLSIHPPGEATLCINYRYQPRMDQYVIVDGSKSFNSLDTLMVQQKLDELRVMPANVSFQKCPNVPWDSIHIAYKERIITIRNDGYPNQVLAQMITSESYKFMQDLSVQDGKDVDYTLYHGEKSISKHSASINICVMD